MHGNSMKWVLTALLVGIMAPDRNGGNETADASHFLYQLCDNFNVTLDLEGPGVLYFARYNHRPR